MSYNCSNTLPSGELNLAVDRLGYVNPGVCSMPAAFAHAYGALYVLLSALELPLLARFARTGRGTARMLAAVGCSWP